MLVYQLVNITILVCSTIFFLDRQDRNRKNFINKLFLWTVGVILIFISGFRGDFTADYNNYTYLFYYYRNFSFKEIFYYTFGQEIGYVVLNWLIAIFTDNSIFVMLVTSILIIVLFFREIGRDSSYVWISVLMFVTIGSYYTSFNIIRQIISVAIVFSGSKYLYNRNFKAYLFFILLGSIFHQTALIMIIFYFLLNNKIKFRNLILITSILLCSIFYLDSILNVIQKYLYSNYTKDFYGMTSVNFKNAVLPISILLFTIIHYSKLDFNEIKVRIWVNAIFFYSFFSILGLKIQMIQRFAEFFAPYVLLLVPFMISRIENNNLRLGYILFGIVILISYNYITLSGSGYDPYYFIVEKIELFKFYPR